MPRTFPHALMIVLLLAPFAMIDPARAADEVTIYRCVAIGGKVSLQDHPCPKDAHQDVREMIRPTDPPPRPQPIARAATERTQAPVEIRIVHVRDPQPLYECRSFDGQTYLSQSGIPQSRFVPLWVLGYHVFNDGGSFADVGRPAPTRLPPSSGYAPNGQFDASATYIQDRCERLPQAEVCQRLSTRKDELGTRIFNAQASDRVRFERERQGLIEQLRSDCSAN